MVRRDVRERGPFARVFSQLDGLGMGVIMVSVVLCGPLRVDPSRPAALAQLRGVRILTLSQLLPGAALH